MQIGAISAQRKYARLSDVIIDRADRRWFRGAAGVRLSFKEGEVTRGGDKKSFATAGPWGRTRDRGLAVTYFHAGIRTIIGAKRFHFRVREGIGWFPLAMATRQTVELVRSLEGCTVRVAHVMQAVWVLYGQAARAISTP